MSLSSRNLHNNKPQSTAPFFPLFTSVSSQLLLAAAATDSEPKNMSSSSGLSRRFLGSDPRLGSPPLGMGMNDTASSDSYSSETSFDTNMVIILAALLCALICALGLNSIARCALRCGRRLTPDTPERAAARLATTGLKKHTLRQLPVAVYGSGEGVFSDSECPICLGEFVDGEKVRVLPKCNHGFHVRCIDEWLVSHSSCPNCRHSLLEHAPPPATRPRLDHTVIVVDS